jgi:cell division transport system ATP-binding protein
MIVLKNVSKAYGKMKVLSDVSFQVQPREFVCVTGPSGAGKSTLIHLLIGAEEASSGIVEVDGVDLRTVPPGAMQLYRRRVGVVFQDYKLLQHRTVYENVAFPLEVAGVTDAAINKRVPEVLKQMGLAHRADALPRELSGGEKARTAIARAVVHTPMIILADEPTGNVDPSQAAAIFKLLKDINASGATVILATHDAAMVNQLQTRVLKLENGKIIRDSVGGYVEKQKAAAKEAASHEVFEKAAPETKKDDIVDDSHKRGPKHKGEEGGNKKIRITPIGRE